MVLLPEIAVAQSDSVPEMKDQQLKEVTVTTRRAGTVKSRGVANADLINSLELLKAACCNLGESFTTNPSVDVNYSDAATGAKQIKLLGLSGTYVQMLAENIPAYRGAASPYSLGYIPGAWMKGIQVSKGSSSVKNGYESMTGQINIGFKEPQGRGDGELQYVYEHHGEGGHQRRCQHTYQQPVEHGADATLRGQS